jgi:hypothetical protein
MGFDLTYAKAALFLKGKTTESSTQLCGTVPIGFDRSRVIDDPIHGCVRNEHGLQCISTVFVETRVNEQWKLEHISRAGGHLMGRVTYQEMSSYWPQSRNPHAAA